MEKRLIARGAIAGAVGALTMFVFGRACAERVISQAIDYEDGRTEAEHALGVHEHGEELFSRAVQSNVGLGFGVLLFGVSMGALLAVAFCLIYRRAGDVGGSGVRALTARLAGGAFVALYLVPFLKYPPNPPAVGQEDSIGFRTGWYLASMLISVVALLAAIWLARRLAVRFGNTRGRLLAGAAYLVALGTVLALLPDVDEVPEPLLDDRGTIIYPGFPAQTLYEFRLSALITQILLWVSIALVFGSMAGRLLDEPAERSSRIPA